MLFIFFALVLSQPYLIKKKNTGNGEFAILQPLDDGLRQGNIHPEADAVQASGSFLPSPKHLYQG